MRLSMALSNRSLSFITMESDCSQYGHNSHGPFHGAKGDVCEGGTRVPMILRYKGTFPTNETRWNLVGLQDLYATICKATVMGFSCDWSEVTIYSLRYA